MSYSNEEVLERFVPQFDEMHTTRFQALVRKIERAFPHYRSQVVQEELNTLERDNDSLEKVKYEAALSVILDLTQQGWELMAHDNDLLLYSRARGFAKRSCCSGSRVGH